MSRQADRKEGAFPFLALDPDPPSVQINDPVDGGKPQAGPVLFRRVKRQKNSIQVLLFDPFACVLERDLDDVGSASAQSHPSPRRRDRQAPA